MSCISIFGRLLLMSSLAYVSVTSCQKSNSQNQSESPGTETAPSEPLELKGVMDSGGGQVYSMDDLISRSAFFTDEARTVHYCIEQDGSFSVRPERVQALAQESVQKWLDLLLKTKDLFPGDLIHASQFQLTPTCDSETDLVIYAGGQPERVPSNIIKNEGIKAWAQADWRNSSTTWSKGFIFFRDLGFGAGDEKSNLAALMLHEWGHVFGVGHIPFTIMDETIMWSLDADPEIWYLDDDLNLVSKPNDSYWPESYRHSIDHQHTLLRNYHGQEVVQNENGITKTLQFSFVSKSKGDVSVRTPLGPKLTIVTEDGATTQYALTIDWQRTRELDFRPIVVNNFAQVGSRAVLDPYYWMFTAIKTGYWPDDFSSNGMDNESPSEVFYGIQMTHYETLEYIGTATRDDGQTFAAIYRKNIKGLAHAVEIFVDGKWQQIFGKKAL